MRILILGGSGMLGHRLWMDLSKTHETWATLRGGVSGVPDLPHIDRSRVCEGVNVLDFGSVVQAFAQAQPDVVINCVGLIKQHKAAKNALPAIDLNARLPHQLADLCAATGSRLVHISTDCVFAGTKGLYKESDPMDAQDVYGRTKALGEVVDKPHCITMRTSIIGREIAGDYGLVEWFLSQAGPVSGYRKAVFSGFPTGELAKLILDYVLPNPDLHGLYHVSAEPINKFDLLTLINEAFRRGTVILPNITVAIDRSLDSERFRAATGFTPRPWPEMILEMAAESLPYDEWKQND